MEYKRNSERNKPLSIKEYLMKLTHTWKLSNNLNKSDTKFIQQISIKFICSKDTNKEIMIYHKADEIIEELFEALLKSY